MSHPQENLKPPERPLRKRRSTTTITSLRVKLPKTTAAVEHVDSTATTEPTDEDEIELDDKRDGAYDVGELVDLYAKVKLDREITTKMRIKEGRRVKKDTTIPCTSCEARISYTGRCDDCRKCTACGQQMSRDENCRVCATLRCEEWRGKVDNERIQKLCCGGKEG